MLVAHFHLALAFDVRTWGRAERSVSPCAPQPGPGPSSSPHRLLHAANVTQAAATHGRTQPGSRGYLRAAAGGGTGEEGRKRTSWRGEIATEGKNKNKNKNKREALTGRHEVHVLAERVEQESLEAGGDGDGVRADTGAALPQACPGSPAGEGAQRAPGLGSSPRRVPPATSRGQRVIPVVHQRRVDGVRGDREEGQQLLLQALQRPLEGKGTAQRAKARSQARGHGVAHPSRPSPHGSVPHSHRGCDFEELQPSQGPGRATGTLRSQPSPATSTQPEA